MIKDLLKKKGFSIRDIMYITRSGRKTVIQLTDGHKLECYETIKSLIAEDKTHFLESINKGIVINTKYVKSMDGNQCVMTDGAAFTVRAKTTAQGRTELKNHIKRSTLEDWKHFEILERMPLAFCVIELVFDKDGHGIDFIFRYCNAEMAELEGKTVEEMIDRPFYEVFENGDKKWLITYADVALNGVNRVIESYSPEIDSNLRIYCYQPKQNFCACALMKL